MDPLKAVENLVEGKVSEVKTWAGHEEQVLLVKGQILAFSKLAEILTSEVEKLKADLLKLPA